MRVKELLIKMKSEGASDLFLSSGKAPRFRRDTIIVPTDLPPLTAEDIDSFRRSVLPGALEKQYELGGDMDAGLSLGVGLRFRLNFFRNQGQSGIVARLVPSGALSFDDLSLPQQIKTFAELRKGLVLIVGPAGSGKSTTMAAILNHINTNFAKHIVTIEDPIEYLHTDAKSFITQREIGSDTLSFSDALRHLLRESPDVIFIGEMRDLETMRTAITAALTGHLVISTLHSTGSVECVERILNHFPEHLREQAASDLSMALEAVVFQKLVRRKDGKGLIPAAEILKGTPLVRNLIGRRIYSELEDCLRRGSDEGMRNLSRALSELYKEGRISLEDGMESSLNRDEFLLLSKGMESGIETFRADFSEDDASGVDMKRLLHSAIANSASDLLITAWNRPCLRVDGDLVPLDSDILSPSDTKRMIFSVLNTHQRQIFEERREIDFALSVNIKRSKDADNSDPIPYRFRINGFFQRGNVAIAVRVIPRRIPSSEELGLPATLASLAKKHQGLILITGPTGHGKSTTMASLIDGINGERPCHIITIEDPIEYVHSNKRAVVEQREVYADTLSFASALKYVLRQDPDVILVGEMRDQETIAAALTAAETGHLVFATLHTNSAGQSIDRIIDSFPAHQQNQIRIQLAGSLLGIVSQRLIQRRDSNGRIAAFEIMLGSSAIRNLIREGKTHLIPSVIETSAKDGMVTMDKALQELYEKNLIKRQDAVAHMASAQAREMGIL